MSEKKWREITLDDLREMSTAERRTCRVRIGDVARDVFAVDDDGTIWTLHVGGTRDWTEYELDHWDAVIEAPVPPPRPLPTYEGAVIRFGPEVCHVTYVLRDGVWWEPGCEESTESYDVQALADKYGWVELVPAIGPDAEDGRSAGIREVAEMFEQYSYTLLAWRIRARFPEAFSDAVNPKETDDE